MSKRYRLRRTAKPDRPRQPLLKKMRGLFGSSDEFWALRDVSFEVERGETLGIVGHNGAGKSTILKLLSSVTTPTSGEITIGGRLSSLIEVGSGFHPELSGRENIYLSGSILGMKRAEIREKLERIIEFSGVGKFIDTPVKFYSSGMYIRLGFSVAAHRRRTFFCSTRCWQWEMPPSRRNASLASPNSTARVSRLFSSPTICGSWSSCATASSF
jgi:lipopolysaccharide transport system ATP-binding protein